MKNNEMIINNNRVFENADGYWQVESADGSWDGYELYDTKQEAKCAALRPNDEDEEIDIDKIKDYWMATMNMGETREEMEQIWSTEEGMEDLMDWFDGEIECGLDEEEMDRVIESVR